MDNKYNTLIVNLFGGPGVGKSTIMAALYYQLKIRGIETEMAPEYAKDLVWEERARYFDEQIYIFAKQLHRINRVLGKVEVIICDSPLFNSSIYMTEKNKAFDNLIQFEFNKFNNINFFITRDTEYVANGRNETAEQAIEKDKEIKSYLIDSHTEFQTLSKESIQLMICYILEKLKEIRKK